MSQWLVIDVIVGVVLALFIWQKRTLIAAILLAPVTLPFAAYLWLHTVIADWMWKLQHSKEA